ncbi:MAG: GNAT family N-acetyltransferase [Bacteroidota bacterium]
MEITLEIFQGHEALELIDQDYFRSAWTDLADQNKKHLVLQRWEFAGTWYKHYQSVYTPLLFVGKDSQHEIVGILALAIHKEDKFLCGAGAEYAEYHGWLCEEQIEETFIFQSLAYLKKQGFKEWKINWLAPGTRVDFLTEARLHQMGIYIDLLASEDPIWNLEDPKKLKKINKRANVKRSFRYFREQGNFRLERIHYTEGLDDLLEELAAQNDFKKEALYNMSGFKGDPLSQGFLKGLMEYPQYNHFSVLWLDDKALAFNHALIEGDELCLASTSYNPAESRNSPGKLHLLELAKMCMEESITAFDLTPGQDVYKSRFANTYREVHRLSFFFSNTAKLKHELRIRIKEISEKLLDKSKMDFRSFKYELDDTKVRFKRVLSLGMFHSISELGKLLYKRKDYQLFQLKNLRQGSAKFPDVPELEISVNDFHDLLDYNEPPGYVSRKDLYLECLSNFGRGDKVYCLKQSGQLLGLAWLRNGKYPLKLHSTKQIQEFPEESFVIYGFREFGLEIPIGAISMLYEKMTEDAIEKGVKHIFLCENKEGRSSASFKNFRQVEGIFSKSYHRILTCLHYAFDAKYANSEDHLIEFIELEKSSINSIR